MVQYRLLGIALSNPDRLAIQSAAEFQKPTSVLRRMRWPRGLFPPQQPVLRTSGHTSPLACPLPLPLAVVEAKADRDQSRLVTGEGMAFPHVQVIGAAAIKKRDVVGKLNGDRASCQRWFRSRGYRRRRSRPEGPPHPPDPERSRDNRSYRLKCHEEHARRYHLNPVFPRASTRNKAIGAGPSKATGRASPPRPLLPKGCRLAITQA